MKASEYLDGHWRKNKIWTHLEWPKHQERLRRCASYLQAGPFCDVGCGLGHSTEIMTHTRAGDWTGIEFQKSAVNEAKINFPDIEFLYVKPSKDWKLKRQWGGVVCSEVIEHVEDDKAFVQNLMTITAGTLVMTTPSKAVRDPGHLRLYTPNMLRNIFVGQKIKIERTNYFFYIIWRRNQ